MEQKRILFLVAVLLGIISVFTGFGAEFTRVKASQVEVDWYGDCSYPKSPAHVLGLTSAATLLTAKLIMDTATGCSHWERANQSPPNYNRNKALLLHFTSW
ncbi:hypothetical protein Goari_012642 [Gossypium aridum]|uniref:Uncharacterized protein n=1 Tax=Gossypium aridum TaxID=34290 RepID=A0A7J8X130_GOSAI|nr:hypothetical protein [Gossypium aridum]